jgi:hypothetical protein
MYEIGLIIFFILFVVVAIETFFQHRREEHEELERFREQQRLEVIATEERKKFVQLHLNSQILTHEGPLNLNEDSDDDDSSQENILTRTLASAGKSFRDLLGSNISKRECTICLAEYQPTETVSWAKSKECSHVFHHDCLIQWLEKHNECPLCRIDILKGVDCEDPAVGPQSNNGDDEPIEAAALDDSPSEPEGLNHTPP